MPVGPQVGRASGVSQVFRDLLPRQPWGQLTGLLPPLSPLLASSHVQMRKLGLREEEGLCPRELVQEGRGRPGEEAEGRRGPSSDHAAPQERSSGLREEDAPPHPAHLPEDPRLQMTKGPSSSHTANSTGLSDL